MKLKELGEKLIMLQQPDWKSLEAMALANIRENEDIEELAAFFEMGPYDLPMDVLIETQERLLHLGDWTKKRLETYEDQLDLYYVKHRLKDWLKGELKQLETTGASAREYEALGREVLRWLHEEDVNG